MQIHRQRLDRRPERRAPLQTLRRQRRHPPPAARTVATVQRDPRHVRPHRRQLDALVDRLRRLLRPAQLRPAVRATLRPRFHHAVRMRMQLAFPHAPCACAGRLAPACSPSPRARAAATSSPVSWAALPDAPPTPPPGPSAPHWSPSAWQPSPPTPCSLRSTPQPSLAAQRQGRSSRSRAPNRNPNSPRPYPIYNMFILFCFRFLI